MSHSPAPPPQLSNNTNNTSNAHSNTSPSQLSQILSTVLADYEALSKDLAIARARYERAEQTIALLKPPHTSLTATGDAPSPTSTYPDHAVKAITELQSHLEAEKAAREAVESRLHTISEAWLNLERYLQASEDHLSDVRSSFSQLIRDPSVEPSFKPMPAHQPHRSTPRAPVAAAQTSPTSSGLKKALAQPSATTSLPARTCHQTDRQLTSRETKQWKH